MTETMLRNIVLLEKLYIARSIVLLEKLYIAICLHCATQLQALIVNNIFYIQ